MFFIQYNTVSAWNSTRDYLSQTLNSYRSLQVMLSGGIESDDWSDLG